MVSIADEITTLYVNAAGSDDSSQSGSITEPLQTIQEAVKRLGPSGGTIIIQSDLNIADQININSNITIKSDNQFRTLYQMINSNSYMFMVSNGTLSLGDKEQSAGGLIIQNNLYYINNVIRVANGTLNLNNSVIIKDPASSTGAIYSDSSVINIDGGAISGSKRSGIYNINGGTVNLFNGTISAGSYVEDYSSGISNSNNSTVNIYGGIITGFNGDSAGSYINGVDNSGTLYISGGTLTSNLYSIRNSGTLSISGNPSIPIGENDINYIYVTKTGPITVNGDLNLAEGNLIGVKCPEPPNNDVLLLGDTDAIKRNYKNFALFEKIYELTEEGKLVCIGGPKIYYVNAKYAYIGDGSIDRPYRTLDSAISSLSTISAGGVIYICSDIVQSNSIYNK